MGLPPSCETTVKHAQAVGNIRRRSAHRRSSLRPSGRKSDVISYRPAVSRILTESSPGFGGIFREKLGRNPSRRILPRERRAQPCFKTSNEMPAVHHSFFSGSAASQGSGPVKRRSEV